MNDVRTNDRGEWTDPAGKLWHKNPAWDASDETTWAMHEGPWLNCDGCNPLYVVALPPDQEQWLESAEALAALRREYGRAKAAEREAKERATTATSKLKAALAEASGNALRSRLEVPGFKPVNLTYSEPWQFNMDALKAAEPETYVKYASKKPNGQWTLAESRGK